MCKTLLFHFFYTQTVRVFIMNRVVVTSVSAITPLGNDVEISWQNLLAGKSGIGKITKFDSTDYATKIAGEVKDFDPTTFIGKKEARRMETFTQYAVCATRMLFESAGWTIPEEDRKSVV